MERALRSCRKIQLPSFSLGGGSSTSCSGTVLKKKHLQIWFDDEDEEGIPLLSRAAEARFRKHAADLARRKANGKTMPVYKFLNIWWGEAGRERWSRRVGVEQQRIWNWGIRGDKRCEDEPSTHIAGAGNKVIEKDSVYLRRMLGTGLGAFSRGAKTGTIIAKYAGQFFDDDALARYKSTSKTDSHKVGWRRFISTAPSGTRGIDGKVSIFQPLTSLRLNHDVVIPNPGQIQPNSKYDLGYYIRNGMGSALNARAHNCGANCRVVAEYLTYDQDVKIHMDDEYCPLGIPFHHRVCAHYF